MLLLAHDGCGPDHSQASAFRSPPTGRGVAGFAVEWPLLGPSAREQLVDHLVGETIANRARDLERRNARGSLRSPRGLAPHHTGLSINSVFVDMTLLFGHAYTERPSVTPFAGAGELLGTLGAWLR